MSHISKRSTRSNRNINPVVTRPEASASANSATSAYYLAGYPAEHKILYHTVTHLSSTFLKIISGIGKICNGTCVQF